MRLIKAVSLALLLFLPIEAFAADKKPIKAVDILDRIDDMWRGDSAVSVFRMKVNNKNWQRSMLIKVISLGKDYSLVRILKPKKDRGVATLKVKDDIWNYLPNVDRTIKVPPSLMMSSWMGSHFTNDDLVKDSRLAEDYTFKITFEGKRNKKEIYEVTLTPKPNAPVVWGKILVEVLKDGYLPLNQKFFDEKGKLARVGEFSDEKVLGGRRMQAGMTIYPSDQLGKPKEKREQTSIEVVDIKFGVKLVPKFFNEKNLKN